MNNWHQVSRYHSEEMLRAVPPSWHPTVRALVRALGLGLALLVGIWWVTPVAAGQGASDRVFDEILDQYVRDGFVYYAAAQGGATRARPACGVAGGATGWVRRLVPRRAGSHTGSTATTPSCCGPSSIHYPIRGVAAEFPESSVMQIPGMFAGREHQIAGRRLTLQAIEDELIAGFGDPRAHLALGRGGGWQPETAERGVPRRPA